MYVYVCVYLRLCLCIKTNHIWILTLTTWCIIRVKFEIIYNSQKVYVIWLLVIVVYSSGL